jgi:hypothetical protein
MGKSILWTKLNLENQGAVIMGLRSEIHVFLIVLKDLFKDGCSLIWLSSVEEVFHLFEEGPIVAGLLKPFLELMISSSPFVRFVYFLGEC